MFAVMVVANVAVAADVMVRCIPTQCVGGPMLLSSASRVGVPAGTKLYPQLDASPHRVPCVESWLQVMLFGVRSPALLLLKLLLLCCTIMWYVGLESSVIVVEMGSVLGWLCIVKSRRQFVSRRSAVILCCS